MNEVIKDKKKKVKKRNSKTASVKKAKRASAKSFDSVKKTKAPKVKKKIEIKPVDLKSIIPDRKKMKIFLVVASLLLALIFAILYVKEKYTVSDIFVEGSTHYSNDEIIDMVLGDGLLSHNSIYLSAKYNDKEIKDIPFVETMNVRILSPSSIRITVYEKAVAGFVELLSRYIYFDKDGTVIESSDIMTSGVPQIIGMKFDHFVLNEKLPVEDEKIFKKILETSQLLGKYDIKIEKIYFDEDYNLTLFFKKVEVKLGSFDNIDEKIIRLKKILPEIEDKNGVLRLENYEEGTVITTFEYKD